MSSEEAGVEWCLLQNQFDSYEKYSLLIKLANAALVAAAVLTGSMTVVIIALLITLWLQDAIWKTYQARIETRLLQLEAAIADGAAVTAYQFNRQFLQNRGGVASLVGEYIRSAIRPTTAFPHVVLVLLAVYSLAV